MEFQVACCQDDETFGDHMPKKWWSYHCWTMWKFDFWKHVQDRYNFASTFFSFKRRVAAQELGGTIFERFEANAIDWFRNRLNEITAVADLYLAVRFLGCFIKYADTLTNLDEFLQRIHNQNDPRLNEYTDTLIVQYPAIFKKEMFSSHESISRRQLLLKLKSIAE